MNVLVQPVMVTYTVAVLLGFLLDLLLLLVLLVSPLPLLIIVIITVLLLAAGTQEGR